MRIILLLLGLTLLFVNATIFNLKMNSKQKKCISSLISAEILMEIRYQGSCKQLFNEANPSISTIPADNCLPFDLKGKDFGDLNADARCTDLSHNSSVLEILRLYQGPSENENIYTGDFIVSVKPTRAIKSSSQLYLRRPYCKHKSHKTYCHKRNLHIAENEYVNSINQHLYILSSSQIELSVCNKTCSYFTNKSKFCVSEYPEHKQNQQNFSQNKIQNIFDVEKDQKGKHKNQNGKHKHPTLPKIRPNEDPQLEENLAELGSFDPFKEDPIPKPHKQGKPHKQKPHKQGKPDQALDSSQQDPFEDQSPQESKHNFHKQDSQINLDEVINFFKKKKKNLNKEN